MDGQQTLTRQLKRCGLDEYQTPTFKAWQKFLKRILSHYEHSEDDRAMLCRALEITTEELNEVVNGVKEQRKRMMSVLTSLANALDSFRSAVSNNSSFAGTRSLTMTRQQFRQEMAVILQVTDPKEKEIFDIVRTSFLKFAEGFISQFEKPTPNSLSINAPLVGTRTEHMRVREMLLPPNALNGCPGAQFIGVSMSVEAMGGDWWVAKTLTDDRTVFIVADATGHSVDGTILTAAAKTGFDLARVLSNKKFGLASMLRMMNLAVIEMGKQKSFVTCSAIIFDPAKKCIKVANAGHVPPILIRGGEARSLILKGSVLGAHHDSEFFVGETILESGDSVVLYSDGFIEATDSRGNEFGERRFKEVLKRGASMPLTEMKAIVVQQVEQFSHVQDDDLTLVIIRVL